MLTLMYGDLHFPFEASDPSPFQKLILPGTSFGSYLVGWYPRQVVAVEGLDGHTLSFYHKI